MGAAGDVEMQLEEQKKSRAKFEDKLAQLFEAADTSGDGRLTAEEFSSVFNDPLVIDWCRLIDIEVHEIQNLFGILDDGDGYVTYHEFLSNMARLKGPASSQDVVTILHDCHNILKQCDSTNRLVTVLVEALCPSGE